MLVALDDSLSLPFNTYDPSTGGSQDADELPTAQIYDSAAAIVPQVVTVVSITTGLYQARFTVDNANFTVGKEYVCVVEAKMTGTEPGSSQVTARASIGFFYVSGVNHGKDLVNYLDGKTPQEALRYVGAILAGLISTAGQANETFKGMDGITDRVTITVDAQGNRSAIVYDP